MLASQQPRCAPPSRWRARRRRLPARTRRGLGRRSARAGDREEVDTARRARRTPRDATRARAHEHPAAEQQAGILDLGAVEGVVLRGHRLAADERVQRARSQPRRPRRNVIDLPQPRAWGRCPRSCGGSRGVARRRRPPRRGHFAAVERDADADAAARVGGALRVGVAAQLRRYSVPAFSSKASTAPLGGVARVPAGTRRLGESRGVSSYVGGVRRPPRGRRTSTCRRSAA